MVAEHGQTSRSTKNLAIEVSTRRGEKERLFATTLDSNTGPNKFLHLSVSYEAKVRKTERNCGVLQYLHKILMWLINIFNLDKSVRGWRAIRIGAIQFRPIFGPCSFCVVPSSGQKRTRRKSNTVISYSPTSGVTTYSVPVCSISY